MELLEERGRREEVGMAQASIDGKTGDGRGPVYRTLVLVRHGQFSPASLSLTRLGRKQAARAGRRLRAFPATKIHCSTMKRAYETALIIAKHHRCRVPLRAHLLRECLPSMPRDRRKSSSVSTEMIRRGKARADRAYRRYFSRPVTREECELLVCHGNVIRYLVGRALGFREHGWHQLGTSHCGITIIRISESGDFTLERHNDTGHLPAALSTT
jgi:serine/threonine-protein phosphatase PGAM5